MGDLSFGGYAGAFIIAVVTLIVYLIPTYVALVREHPNKVPIIIINIFLGWTYIAWVLTLAWACTRFKGEKDFC